MIRVLGLLGFFLLVWGVSPPANAAFTGGDQLVNECEDQSMLCLGLLTGIADALDRSNGMAKPKSEICLTGKVTPTDLLSVLQNELKAHPEEESEAAVALIAKALHRAYPCH